MNQSIITIQLILILGLFGCASGGKTEVSQPLSSVVKDSQAPLSRKAAAESYIKNRKIHSSDMLILHVVPGKEFEKQLEVAVNLDGEILIPLIGWIKVEGMTTTEAEEKIKGILDKSYIVNPTVSLRIKEASVRAIVILGQIRKPGTYEFPASGKMTFLEVVAKAEGFTDIANLNKVKIVRNTIEGSQQAIHVNAQKILNGEEPDVELQEGDLITIPETVF